MKTTRPLKGLKALFERKCLLLLRHGNICVPQGKFKVNLLNDYYSTPNTAHLLISKNMKRISQTFYWKSLRTDVLRYARSCHCQREKTSNHKPAVLLQPLESPKNKWTHITMDLIKSLQKWRRKQWHLNFHWQVIKDYPNDPNKA